MAFFRSRETFFEAAMTGDVGELAYCLDNKKFSINVADSFGNTALHVAIQFRQGDAIKLLLRYGPDFDAQGKDGLTPLMLAMEKCKPSLIIPIIRAPGGNPNTHDNNYVYPLHKAAATGEMDIVKALVEHGADVNVRTRDTEDTPLHMAIANGRRAVAEYLVHKGARIDIAGKEGKTAQQLAKEAGPKMYAIIDPQSVANDRMREAPMEVWELATPTQVAKISTLPALQRKITEIFNFETRERMTVTRNLKTGAESVGEAEAFASLAEEAVDLATQKLKTLGGRAPGSKPEPKVGGSVVGKFKI
ncbi:MAG: ankyrin repeat domain-containing protein [Alphaproteobacteria bacterium]